jgi:hypothetical protein
VRVHDFLIKELGRATPYGIYDLAAKAGWVSVGIERDPGSAEARIQLAWWYFWDVWTRQGDLQALQAAGRLAREALHIDPRDARALLLSGSANSRSARCNSAPAIGMQRPCLLRALPAAAGSRWRRSSRPGDHQISRLNA